MAFSAVGRIYVAFRALSRSRWTYLSTIDPSSFENRKCTHTGGRLHRAGICYGICSVWGGGDQSLPHSSVSSTDRCHPLLFSDGTRGRPGLYPITTLLRAVPPSLGRHTSILCPSWRPRGSAFTSRLVFIVVSPSKWRGRRLRSSIVDAAGLPIPPSLFG